MPRKDLNTCTECGSKYFRSSSKMASLCPECSYLLYGYENCVHEFKDGRCIFCHWDGSVSDMTKEKE